MGEIGYVRHRLPFPLALRFVPRVEIPLPLRLLRETEAEA